MKNIKRLTEVLLSRKQKNMRKRLLAAMMAIVVFCTTYLLVLPAITLDNQTAATEPGIEAETVAEETLSDVQEADYLLEGQNTAEDETSAAEPETEAIVSMTTETEAVVSVTETEAVNPAPETEAINPVPETEVPETEVIESAEETEAVYTESPLICRCGQYDVELSFDSEGWQLPEGTVLTVKELHKEADINSEEYRNYHYYDDRAKEELADLDEEFAERANAVHFYELALKADGKELSMPQGGADITIKYNPDGGKFGAEDTILAALFWQTNNHTFLFDKNGDNSGVFTLKEHHLKEIHIKDLEVSDFENVIGLYACPPEKNVTLNAEGSDYSVTAVCGWKSGVPEDAKLTVSEIKPGSKAFEQYLDSAREALGEDQEDAVPAEHARFFDIKIMVDGKEFTPEAEIDVKIGFHDPVVVEQMQDVSAVHFGEEGTEVLDVTTEEGKEGIENISFAADSFSVYGVVYTVDFEYTDGGENEPKTSQFSIEGGSSITLSELIEVLDILDGMKYKSVNEFIADVENVEFSNPKFVWVGKAETDTTVGLIKSKYDIQSLYSTILSEEELAGINASKISSGDWILISLLPFSTTETLTVRMKNGETISIKVTDAFSVGSDNYRFTAVPHAVPRNNGEELDHHKTLTPNKAENGEWDGTYTLSLDIVGKKTSEESTTVNKADVIVVLDNSSSMNKTNNGSSRFEIQRNAVKGFGEYLLNLNNSNPGAIQISVMTYGTLANEPFIDHETNTSAFVSAMDGLTPPPGETVPIEEGGQATNWEDALQKANAISTRSDAEKFVIFISDGNPTVRNTQGETGWAGSTFEPAFHNARFMPAGYDVWGYGFDYPPADSLLDNDTGRLWIQNMINQCYKYSKDYAKAIVDSGKNFYTISVFEEIGRMENLTAYAYSGSDGGTYPEGHYNTAIDAQSLSRIFSQLFETTSSAVQYQNVKITDTLTVATKTSLEVTGHANDFKYYKDGDEWDEAPEAHYENGQVVWDLGEDPLDNATYTVSFTVWPNQDAYDAIVKLNNGDATEEDIQRDYPDVYANLKQEDGKYVIYSNGNATVSYQKATSENGGAFELGEVQTLYYPRPTMETLEYKMKVAKIWKDSLYADNRPDSITFNIKEDGKPYKTVTLTSENASSSDPDRWEAEIPISPGIISDLIIDGIRLNNGHEYTIEEAGDSDYHYDFDPEVLIPILENGTMHFLGDTDNDESLSGTNHMRGSMTITKKVVDSLGNDISADESVADQDFKFKVYLRDSDGQEIAGKTEDDEDAIWYRLLDDTGQEIGSPSVINSGDQFTLKAGHSLRLLNLPRNYGYKVEEIDIPEGYQFDGEEYNAVSESSDQTVELMPDAEGYCFAQPNTWQYVTVTNKKEATGSLKITKSVTVNGQVPENDTLTLADGTYTFEIWNADATESVTTKADGSAIGELKITVTNGVASPSELTIDGLTPGTYVVKESGNGNNGGVVLDTTAGGYNAELGGIAVTVKGNDADGVKTAAFTNKYETTESTITKNWINKGKPIPDSLTVTLLKNGEETNPKITKTLSGTNNWTQTVTGLQKYLNGEEISYSWREESIPGYFHTGYENNGTSITLTNTYGTYELETSYQGTKKWSDESNKYNTRPENLTVILQQKTDDDAAWTDLDLAPTWTGKDTDTWTYSFEHLPVFDDNGKVYRYQAKETEPEGYTGTSTNTPTKYSMGTITYENGRNRVTPDNQVIWTLNTTTDLAFVAIAPTANGNCTVWTHRLPTPDERAAITKLIHDDGALPPASGRPIDFYYGVGSDIYTPHGNISVTFDPETKKVVLNFGKTKVWSQFIVGNFNTTADQKYNPGTTNFENALEVTDLNGSKTWVINGTTVPDNPILTLTRTVTVTTGEGDDAVTTTSAPEIVKEGETQVNLQPTWSGDGMTRTFTYSGLPAKDKDGNVYTYSVSEYQFTVDGVTYTVTKNQSGAYVATPDPEHAATASHFEVTQSGNDITNAQTTEFEFSKIWQNTSGETETWPAGKTITVILNASTSTEAKALDDISLTFSPDNLPEGWTVVSSADGKKTTFKTTGLAVAKDGAALTYYVVETQVAGYKAPSYADADGHGLVNVGKAENGQQIINTPEDAVELPSTGGPGTRLFTILGSILILGAGALLVRRRRLI